MGSKGYVVRWVGSGDGKRWCDSPGEAAAEAWGRSLSDRCTDVAIFRVLADGTEERLPSYEEALDRLDRDDEHVKAIDHYREGLYRILRGEVDPIEIAGTYLGEDAPKSDPLATLEAAERRLLESARWTPGDRGFWIDPDDGTQWPREGAISDVRRRLAAKGGA